MYFNPLKRKQGDNKPLNGTESPPFKQPKNQNEVQKILQQRKSLPIYAGREKFLQEAKQHDAIILVGETGSGKTTQIPQYLYESGLNRNNNQETAFRIAVTQPRRVAAISLAKRVSEEIEASNGSRPCMNIKNEAKNKNIQSNSVVGYKVRFEDSTDPKKTVLIFQTDGMLLREAMLDPLLSRYSWIILDEAHERKIETDILFGVIKNALTKRKQVWNHAQSMPNHENTSKTSFPPLKVIIMSATLNAETFSAYFRNAPILHVLGRQHPVNIRSVTKVQEDWHSAIMATIFQIHGEAPEKEDILVFMTGQEEIESMARDVRLIANDSSTEGSSMNLVLQNNNTTFQPNRKLNVVPLYAAQQLTVMDRIMKPSILRKIILATNIAETSITIPRVKHVIDSCRVKAKSHQASTGLDLLKTVKISKAQALQRTGRAGRESEGNCYRMLTRNEFERLPEETTPEIKRCNLTNVVLQMISIGIENVSKFDFLDPPPKDAVEGALRQLVLLGAIECKEENSLTGEEYLENSFKLTAIGKQMAIFPLDPRYSKAILSAEELGCTEEVITIVSMLSGDNIFFTPSTKKDEVFAARKHLISSEGDHITYLKIFRAFKQSSNSNEFCKKLYVNQRHIKFAAEVRKQLMDLCTSRANIKVQSCGSQTTYESVRIALSRGLFTNVARLTREGHFITLDSRQKVTIHPSSVMFSTKPEIVIFNELIATQKTYIRDLSLVDANWLLKDQPEYFKLRRGHILAPEKT